MTHLECKASNQHDPSVRLLHVLSGLEVGGKERVVLDLARRGRERGMDQRLFLFDTPFRDEELDFDPGAVPVAFRKRGPGVDWKLAGALARYLRDAEFDVVHAHNDTALFYCALARVRLHRLDVRFVATFHTRPTHATRGARILTRVASRRMSGITAVSDDLRMFLVQSGWVRHCRTLWNGIDLERFTPEGADGGWRERLVTEPGEVLVLHIGRHDPVKRQIDLVAAARSLHGHRPCLRFALVGRGPESESLRAASAGIESLRWLPRVHDVEALLRAADVFLLCSREEAAPRVLLEAMASGRAILATDVGGCRQMMTGSNGEVCGLLVPPGDPRRLAEALSSLARDPTRRAELGRLARLRAQAFSHEREWEQYCELWNGPVGQPQAP